MPCLERISPSLPRTRMRICSAPSSKIVFSMKCGVIRRVQRVIPVRQGTSTQNSRRLCKELRSLLRSSVEHLRNLVCEGKASGLWHARKILHIYPRLSRLRSAPCRMVSCFPAAHRIVCCVLHGVKAHWAWNGADAKSVVLGFSPHLPTAHKRCVMDLLTSDVNAECTGRKADNSQEKSGG